MNHATPMPTIDFTVNFITTMPTYAFGEVIAVHHALDETILEHIPHQAHNEADEDYDPTPRFAVHGHGYATLPEAVAAVAMLAMGMNINRVWPALDALRGMAK